MKQIIVKYGTIAGVALIGYLLLFYFWDKNMMLGVTARWSAYIIYALGMYAGAMKVEGEDFKTVLRTAFGIFIVINLFYYGFDYLIFNHLDPTLEEAEKKIMIDFYNANVKTVEEAQRLTHGIQEGQFHSLKSLAFAFSKGAIGGFGLSILISYLVKRRN